MTHPRHDNVTAACRTGTIILLKSAAGENMLRAVVSRRNIYTSAGIDEI
jgi:hypothetical protein